MLRRGRHCHAQIHSCSVLPLPTHPANLSQSSIRPRRPSCINASTGIARHQEEECPMWTKPAFTDLRIGFEVTMYFANR